MSKYTRTIEKIRREAKESCFIFYNANPAAKFTDDCVIRAISMATGKSWGEVFQALSEEAFKEKLVYNDERVYGKYLCSLKWQHHNKPVMSDFKGYTVREFLKIYHLAAVIHVNEDHLSYVNNGKIFDTRNPENGMVGTFWTPPQDNPAIEIPDK